MHDRRRLALDALRIRSALTVNELATELRLTRAASANHLARLLAEGLVVPTGLRSGKRRPSVMYGLTARADSAFHQEYEKFAIDLLDEVARPGPGAVSRILRRVGDRWIARDLPEVETLRGATRLDRATKTIATRGFMPSLERAGRSYVLRNHNCPISKICGAHHEAADMVKRWVEALLGAQVQRKSCICQGGRACEYRVLPTTRRAAQSSAATK